MTAEQYRATFKSGADEFSIRLHMSPFLLELDVNGRKAISANSRGLFNFEEYRTEKHPKPAPAEHAEGAVPAEASVPDYPYDVDGMYEESFGGHQDTKPRGPSAVALDFSFEGSNHIYGLPEHASSLTLKNTQVYSFFR